MNLAHKSVLVVDDEPGIRMALKTNFQNAGWNVETASGATEAIRKYGQTKFPLVVTDVRMPDGNGLEVMRSVRAAGTSTAVILLTAFGTVSEAVQAMQGGACDYLVKPFSFDQLQSAVERVMQQADAPAAKTSKTEIVGNSLALVHALDRARLAAQTDADVLVEAESGTGKELLARFIHETSSRREKPLVAINCAAVPEQLLESELFGHVRGAFTGANLTKTGKFELANGGTLLLDEIGEMPLELQPKLLRVLQEREVERLGDTRTVPVNIRVIATTNVSLQAMVDQGRFRADLYYRLNVIPLTLPPLRERQEDIPLLATHFATKFARQAGRPAPELHPEFLTGLQKHCWPGNARELANFMRRVIAMSNGNVINTEYLGPEFIRPTATKPTSTALPLQAGTSMRELERQLLETTLQLTGGNRTRAAEMLGVSLRTIRNKIREFGLPPRRYA
ncbi:MAG TPA: sigma-54 dependent transcriptional regulator [Terriglobales bacterium]|jgi:DNA-binding NtrC family response regulator